jgi:hypothetical protein
MAGTLQGAPQDHRVARRGRSFSALQKGLTLLVSIGLVVPPACAPVGPTGSTISAPSATTAAIQPVESGPPASRYNPEQLDAMLASIALYPDKLLVQVLMASTNPLEIVEASRWLASDNNRDLKGDALARALEPLPWDPSVKSLVPFPQVLEQMNQHLDWTQQVGYAVTIQQADVLDSVQRLRRQAQAAGTLKTTEQQVVTALTSTDDAGAPLPEATVVIQPADPQTVYVPVYNPSVIYGMWPYPAYPPVYYSPPGYYLGTGLAFAAGVVVVGSLWGWAGPSWGYHGGTINVDRSRYTNISINNPNRGNVRGSSWQPPARGSRSPPGGPVGSPARAQGLPANAVGRPNVQVPASTVNRSSIGENHTAGLSRPSGGNIGQGSGQPTQRSAYQAAAGADGGAFSGMRDGAQAGQFQQRGAQSVGMQQRARSGFGGASIRGGGFRGGGRRR